MGHWISTVESRSLKKAEEIRDDLYERVEHAKIAYQAQYSQISLEKINKIKIASGIELADMMDSRCVTAVEVMLTFIHRAATFGVHHNYVMDQMFEEALEQARQCDKIRKENELRRCWRDGMDERECLPPFFGVPLSLKESILYKGRVSYCGHVHPVNKIPENDSVLIILLKRMGFIPFVRTTVPQANKTFQTNNHIFGYALNPWNNSRSCGGSSGGEGGLIASYCSPFGVGSDVAGSARTPCEWTGLITLKPDYRYTCFGNAYTGKYAAGLGFRVQTAPITRSVEDVILFSKFMYNEVNYENIHRSLMDPYQKLHAFDNSVFLKKPLLKIGCMYHIKNKLNCSKSHERAVTEVGKVLSDLGHSVKEIQIPHLLEIFLYVVSMWFSDRSLDVLKELRQGEPGIIQFKLADFLAKLPWFVKLIVSKVLRRLKENRLANIVENAKPMSAKEHFNKVYEYQVTKREQVYKYLVEKDIDIVICPGMAIPAIKTGTSHKMTILPSYSSVWNILRYPAGVMPITRVNEDELEYEDEFEDRITKSIRQNIRTSIGLPVGVQIVALPGKEEHILYIMKQIETQVKFRSKHICPAFHQ